MNAKQKAAFLEAATRIEANPTCYHQGAWFRGALGRSCGCVLSHVTDILGGIKGGGFFSQDVGLSSEVYWRVFTPYGQSWPSPYKERLQKATRGTKAYAKAGASLLRAIARKGEARVFGEERGK